MKKIDCFQGRTHSKKAQHQPLLGVSPALTKQTTTLTTQHTTPPETSTDASHSAGIGGYIPFTDALGDLDLQDQRGHSYALTEAANRPKQVWNGDINWVEQTLAAILDPANAAILLHPVTLATATIEAVLTAMANAADSTSGRFMTASLATLARSASMSSGRRVGPETVSKVRCYAKKLGYAAEEARGRYLTAPERLLACLHHGGRQIRAASTWCLIIPRPPAHHTTPVDHHRAPKPQVEKISRLPSVTSFNLLSLESFNSPTRAQAHARPASGLKKKSRTTKSPKTYPVAVWRLVSELCEVLPWLDRGQHRGAICAVIADLVEYSSWSAIDIRDILDADTKARGWNFPTHIDRPIAYLRWRLTQLSEILAGLSPTEQRTAQRRELVEEENRHAARTGSRFRSVITDSGARRIVELPQQAGASVAARQAAMAQIRAALSPNRQTPSRRPRK